MLPPDEPPPPSSIAADYDRKVLAAMPMAQLVFGLSQGIEPERLCSQAGFSLTQLSDRDRFVPHAWYLGLWDALRTQCPGIPVGITFGQFITPDHLGYVGQVFRHAKNGLDALHKLVRFGSLFDSLASRHPTRIHTTGEGVRVVGSTRVVENRLECIEASLFGLITQLNAVTDTPVKLLQLNLHITDQRHRDLYEEFFACPIRFGADPEDGVVFARETLLQPLRGANVELADRIESYVLQTYGSPDESFEAKLRAIVRDQLRNATFSQREAARALGLSARTLERRLNKEGNSFGQLVEEVRRQEALRMLNETDAAVYEIAFCLGYRDVSSFSRAFKRWLGTSPRAYREGSAPPP